MKPWFILLWGEWLRLWKYKIFFFGVLVSLIWVLIISFVTQQEALSLMPMLLILDTGMMVILLLASSYYFEKQEGTIKSLLVAPVHPMQILTAKIASTFISGIVSMLLIGLAVFFIHGITSINYPLAFLYVVVSTLAHVALGFLLIFQSSDFMSLLTKYSLLAVILFLPIAFDSLDLLPSSWAWVYFLSPSYSGQTLMQSLIQTIDVSSYIFSFLSLILWSVILYPFAIYSSFKKEAIKA